MNNHDNDIPLKSQIIDGQLIISIGVNTMAWAAEQSDDLGFISLEVVNKAEFARDIQRELNEESEDGSTMITRMLDKAVIQTIEQGSIAIRTEETAEDETDFGDED
jgi:hypothetical protein